MRGRMSLEDLFNGVKISQEPFVSDDFISIEKEGIYYHFLKEDLSQREYQLLSLFQNHKIDKSVVLTPWERFLESNHSTPPISFTDLQFIYLNHSKKLSVELVDLLNQLIPVLESIVTLSDHESVLIVNQSQFFEVNETLKNLLPTLESDFEVTLSLCLGNRWHQLDNDHLKKVYQEERQLWQTYVREQKTLEVTSFTHLILWGLSHQKHFSVIKQLLVSQLSQVKETKDVVEALWESQGNLAQTAQKLFIHRNSLNYKLDKIQTTSGLNLKQLEDLTISYLLLLEIA